MKSKLANLFIELCEDLRMPENDPLMYVWIIDHIEKMQTQYITILTQTLQRGANLQNDIMASAINAPQTLPVEGPSENTNTFQPSVEQKQRIIALGKSVTQAQEIIKSSFATVEEKSKAKQDLTIAVDELQPILAPLLDEWIEKIQIQAIGIISKLREKSLSKVESKINGEIYKDAELIAAIKKNIPTLIIQAQAIKQNHSDSNIETITTLIAEDEEQRKLFDQYSSYGKLLDTMRKKVLAGISLDMRQVKERAQQENVDLSKETSKLKAMENAAHPFFKELAEVELTEYPNKTREFIEKYMAKPTGIAVSREDIHNFLDGIEQRVALVKKIHLNNALVYTMKTLGVIDLDQFLLLAHTPDNLVQELHKKLTANASESKNMDNIAANPKLLFHVIIKLATDNLLEDLSLAEPDKGYERKYFSKNGISFTRKSLHTMYASVLKLLDYKVHMSNESYEKIKSTSDTKMLHKKNIMLLSNAGQNFTTLSLTESELKAIKEYNNLLIVLATYAEKLENVALTINKIKTNKNKLRNKLLPEYADELAEVSKELREVSSVHNTLITEQKIRTLIDFTVRVIEISHNIEKQHAVKHNPQYDKENYSYIRIILSKIFDLIINIVWGTKQQVTVQPHILGDVEKMQLQILHDVQNFRIKP